MGMFDCHRCSSDLVFDHGDSRQEWRHEYYICPNCDQEYTRTIIYKTQSSLVESDNLEMNIPDELSDKMKEMHVENQDDVCPYCGEDDIQGIEGPVIDDNLAKQWVRCVSCNKTWANIYKLHGIYEDKQ